MAKPTDRCGQEVELQALWLPHDEAFVRFVEIPGEGPPLLWLHGWQCSSTGELLPPAVQAPLRSRRSFLVDLLGHGYSDKPPDFAYTLEAHARTVVALIDALGLERCGIVGHSMGGGVGTLVAAERPDVVSLLVMAEGYLDPEGGQAFDGQTEAEFVASGLHGLIDGQMAEAVAAPTGLRATHVGITRLIEPRALYREEVSMMAGTDPSIRSLLARLTMPRWYLIGALSDAEDLQAELASVGVGWKVVPDAGHPMGLQNPTGVAQAVAEAAAEAWPA